MSLPVSLISPADASMRIHSKIVIVVLEGIALRTILTPDRRSDLLQMIFIVYELLSKMHVDVLCINNIKIFSSSRSRGCEYVDNSSEP